MKMTQNICVKIQWQLIKPKDLKSMSVLNELGIVNHRQKNSNGSASNSEYRHEKVRNRQNTRHRILMIRNVSSMKRTDIVNMEKNVNIYTNLGIHISPRQNERLS